jgi:hypothetical protein
VPSPSEHVVEIRFQPIASILDRRGEWAEVLSSKLELPRWQIIQNRLDVFEDSKSRSGFLSFRNLGLTVQDAPTRNYFPDQLGKFIRAIFALKGFGDRLPIARIGVRSRFCDPFDAPFHDLQVRFATRYVTVTPAAKQALGDDVELIDVGAPLNFKDRLGLFNTLAGPMKVEEFKQFFQRENEPEFPEVGLYYDIDYFKLPNAVMRCDELVHAATDFATAAWDRHERVKTLILGA